MTATPATRVTLNHFMGAFLLAANWTWAGLVLVFVALVTKSEINVPLCCLPCSTLSALATPLFNKFNKLQILLFHVHTFLYIFLVVLSLLMLLGLSLTLMASFTLLVLPVSVPINKLYYLPTADCTQSLCMF